MFCHLISYIDSLSCYKCTSEHSNKDCKSKMESIACSPGTSQCLLGTLKCTQGSTTKTIYYKRCNAPNLSSCGSSQQDMPKCPSPGSWGTVVNENCCNGDNCNSGSSYSINQVMLGICMAFAFWVLAFIL